MRVLKNYAYNLSYQLLVILLPIITTPYITRVFSSDELGEYGYYASISTYFVLLAGLGVANYGTKEISAHSREVSETFWGIYSIQFIAGILSIVTYILACCFIPKMNNAISFILIVSLFARVLDISWLFQGMEDFKKITIRNVLVKLVGVIAIFVFIKQSKDLLLYVFLLVGFDLFGQLSMWFPAIKHIGKPHFTRGRAKAHLSPIFVLFLPQVAISLYITLDRTMLGSMATSKDVGIFDQAQKIITILLTVVTSLGSVMLPRISNLLSTENHNTVNRMYEWSFLIYNLIIFPTIAGVLVVNNDFVSFFLGEDFRDAKIAIYIMVFKMFFIGWTNIMGIQILIPHGKNKEFMLSTTLPAIFSVFLNFILLPRFGFVGASITSLLTEVLVWGIQFYYVRSYLKTVSITSSMLKIFIATFMMAMLLLVFKPFLDFPAIINVLIYILVGMSFYIYLLVIFKVIDFKTMIIKIFRK